MPVLLETNQEFDVVLESDKNKVNPPKFVFKALSCRDWRKLAKLADAISAGSTDDAIDTIFGMLKIGLVNWDLLTANGSKIPFNPDDLEDIITLSEANELLEKFKNQGIGAAERKN